MSTPDPHADRARRFADAFNTAAAHDDAAWLAREVRPNADPGFTAEILAALAAIRTRLTRYGPTANSDAIASHAGER